MLTLNDVKKKYGKSFALASTSYDFPSTGLFCVYGPNGSGKSTLFKLIAGLERASGGKISLTGCTPSKIRNYVTFVRSYFSFDEKTTVDENLSLPFRSLDEEKKKVVLNELGLYFLRDVKCESLSEGEKRRLNVARGIVSTSPILLLDEPFASLDETNKAIMASLLTKESASRLVIFSSNRSEVLTRMSLSGVLGLRSEGKTLAPKKTENETVPLRTDNRIRPLGLFARLLKHRAVWAVISFIVTLGLSLSAFLFLPSGLNDVSNDWKARAEFSFCERNLKAYPITRYRFDPDDGIVHYGKNLEARPETYYVSGCLIPLYPGYISPNTSSDHSRKYLGSEIYGIRYYTPATMKTAEISLLFGSIPSDGSAMLISSYNYEEMLSVGAVKGENDALALSLNDPISGRSFSVSGVYKSDNSIFANANIGAFCNRDNSSGKELLWGRCEGISLSDDPKSEDQASLFIPMSALKYSDVERDYIIPGFTQRPLDNLSDWDDYFPFLKVAASIKERDRVLGWSLFSASLVFGLFSFALLSFSLEQRKRALLSVSSSRYLSAWHFVAIGLVSFLVPEVIGMAFVPLGLNMANEALRSTYWSVITASAFTFTSAACLIVSSVIVGSLLVFLAFTLAFAKKNKRFL